MRSNRKRLGIAAVLTGAVLLGGCGTPASVTTDKISVVCTNFPEYDWTMQLLAGHEESFEVTYLLENGMDIHNYQPTAADVARISGCDLFICVGGESEYWVADVVTEAVNPDMQVIRLLDEIDALEEELLPGMQTREDDAEEPETDEHVWLSVKNAGRCCASISRALCALDSSHAQTYSANLAAYQAQLDALDAAFYETYAETETPVLVVADRFPFRYFIEDYPYTCYAAFAGCSAETEASFQTIAFLAEQADANGVDTIFTIEGGGSDIAQAVAANTKDCGKRIAKLNSLQSVTRRQIDDGATYISLMEENLTVLKEAAGIS